MIRFDLRLASVTVWVVRFVQTAAFSTSLLFQIARPALSQPEPASPSHVLVVANTKSADSVAIASYYAKKRHLPDSNYCKVSCTTEDECPFAEFREFREGIRQHISKNRLVIDYIVLTRGIPVRTKEGESGGYSVDSWLTTMDLTAVPPNTIPSRMKNPYFGVNQPFSHARYKIYLVTRIDGYTRQDCFRLVDNSLSAKPEKGLFLFDVGPGHEVPGYKHVSDGMRAAFAYLKDAGFNCILKNHGPFAGDYKRLMGYYSWGSNDSRYNKDAFHSLGFLPGALAETAVSTSGRTFRDPKSPGQSLMADLIAQGVTGCKAYVSEPWTDSMAFANVLFARYTSGYNLAESFYMASYRLRWKDIVIGDPLCAPYSRQ